jgi:hypothetical protein
MVFFFFSLIVVVRYMVLSFFVLAFFLIFFFFAALHIFFCSDFVNLFIDCAVIFLSVKCYFVVTVIYWFYLDVVKIQMFMKQINGKRW